MKNFVKTEILMIILFIITSCSDDNSYLKRLPLDQVSSDQYWNSDQDYENYLNTFYPILFTDGGIGTLPYIQDRGTDDIISKSYPIDLAGERVVPDKGGGWNFNNIRNINIFFEAFFDREVEQNSALRNLLGEAHFIRGYLYFQLLKQFGSIPYFTTVLDMDSDFEELNIQIPRNIVIDNIIEDLDSSIELMDWGPNKDKNRLSKECALLLKSRICLFEGTWEKYHANTVFGVENPNYVKYLTLAYESAGILINSNRFSLYDSPNGIYNSYFELFNKNNYSDVSEVLLWEKYSSKYGNDRTHQKQVGFRTGAAVGISKSLVDDYLCIDGLPISMSPLWSNDSLANVFDGRDPRLVQTVWNKGQPDRIAGNNDTVRLFGLPVLQGENSCPTGYQLKKGAQIYENDFVSNSESVSTSGTIYFRYAEALLNYAEAKAELGILSQDDLDKSINKLRDRAGMPSIDISRLFNDPNWVFKDIDPIINEIRRERHIELVGEGFRKDDLYRWAAKDLLVGLKPKGILFDSNLFPDISVGSDIYLDEKGFIEPYFLGLPHGFRFDPQRDYLSPIPKSEIVLSNNNLMQNPGW